MRNTTGEPGGFPLLQESEHRLIADFVEKEFGIKMPSSKKVLIQGRLAKRLRACHLHSYGDYFRYITQEPAGRDEFLHFTDLVSTHETSFYREEKHFTFLRKEVFPLLLSQSSRREISILSAACSSGEEAYTLAMETLEACEQAGRKDLQVWIEGFDLSQRMVDAANRGVYTVERTARIPSALQKKYLLRSKDPHKQVHRFAPEVRALMHFHTGNILGALALQKKTYDLIFCRNVLIYFDRENQTKAVRALLSALSAEGHLCLGHSESMTGMNLPITAVTSAIYKKG